MKTKHFKHIICLFIDILIVFTIFASSSKATLNLNIYKPTVDPNNVKVIPKADRILGGVQVVGSIASVVVLVIIGIKYMAGSIEDKAEYKKTMFPYIIGAVLLFASSNLVQVLYDLGQKINE